MTFVVLGGEPGRSLCQDVALLLKPPDFASQARQLFSLRRAQHIPARQRLAVVRGRLRHPSGDALRGDAELTRELRRRAASLHELDHLASELRRIRRSGSGHWTPSFDRIRCPRNRVNSNLARCGSVCHGMALQEVMAASARSSIDRQSSSGHACWRLAAGRTGASAQSEARRRAHRQANRGARD